MADFTAPAAEEIVVYDKAPASKIATITLNRPDRLNAPTTAARQRYAALLHRANVDDDVKVLVIRGAGDDLGSGVDLPEYMEDHGTDAHYDKEFGLAGQGVTYPPLGSYRHGAQTTQWFANPTAGCRSLQDFKKISILEVKGYCYGWHFYQAADADLVLASDDALFGHAAFRYAGAAPRMWQWVSTMGLRKFQEMLFTGRPFTAEEMYECGFLNSIVPRAELESETERYAHACAANMPTDTVFMQKIFLEIFKQHRGEYMGSVITGLLESMGNLARPDADELVVDEQLFERGLSKSVKDFDNQFPRDWRLSRRGRRAPADDQEQ
jgi:enoyl-CoA hydratase/carnithine racemase